MAVNLESVFQGDYKKLFKIVDKRLWNFCVRILREFFNDTSELNESVKIDPGSKDLLTIFAEKVTEMELAFIAPDGDVQDEFWKILEKIQV
ncbi:hypothetical protein DASC09_009610 [Saccharomycopsis crataegensis]|uniref:Uncharacterized protein n=1 Tax=Saccharomycopsis crataegensis TaxID=43959 RepID=A0AAV5QFZ1_9ASCO|nr:hypothetical protein DASC09_009610 [Saccharomycopsis crataegensis]